MDAQQLAAQFAAYTWYNECHASPADGRRASQFARDKWLAFVGTVPEGFGRLLRRVSRVDRYRRRRATPLHIGRAT
jgi:hypothetical protein